MEHNGGGGGGGGNRAEALRWLSIAEKLLAARDFIGTRSFAIRARESDPIVLEAADRVIAVADTLLAAEGRINNQYDWYGILQISQPTQSIELIATQYRRLALLLHPEANRVAFADHAFRLVSDAWCVLSNPLRKALYDNDYLMCSKFSHGTTGSSQKPKSPPHQPQFPQPVRTSPRKETRIMVEEPQHQERPPPPPPPERPLPTAPAPAPPAQPQPQPPLPSPHRPQQQEDPQQQQHQFVRKNPKSMNAKVTVAEERPNVSDVPESTQETTQQQIDSNRPSREAESTLPTESSIPSFWTACPYCYNLYEYPKGYEDCVLRCQNCAKAFQAVVIPSPPVAESASTFCCWGFFPLGVSANAKGTTGSAAWSPFSAMFTCPLPGQGGARSGKTRNVKSAKKSTPRFFCEEDDIYVEVSEPSDSSDEEWGRVSSKKKRPKRGLASRNDKRAHSESLQKGNQGNVGNGNADVVENMNGQFGEQNGLVRFSLSNSTKGESSKKAVAAAGGTGKKHKGKGPKELGKLDLNVEFSNEVEEPATGVSEGHGEDNIEGIGFFEGLDEFLNSLPILNAVADDKVKAS